MRIGYPCINRTVGCLSSRTFRLKSFSEDRLISTINSNLDCLMKILEWNLEYNILHFRITSDLVPFASHPINRLNWQHHFKSVFRKIGRFATKNSMRISMHPGQYTLLNSPKEIVHENSLKDLEYHTDVLDLMDLNNSSKIQIHVGGVYGDKNRAIKRFISRYERLDSRIKRRLVVENDERSYSVADCIKINEVTGVPIVLDSLHHETNNNHESITQAVQLCIDTWHRGDGVPIIDYSTQDPGQRPGKHAMSINLNRFKVFLEETKPYDFDIMLEIKDKETSALKAIEIGKKDNRFQIKLP